MAKDSHTVQLHEFHSVGYTRSINMLVNELFLALQTAAEGWYFEDVDIIWKFYHQFCQGAPHSKIGMVSLKDRLYATNKMLPWCWRTTWTQIAESISFV